MRPAELIEQKRNGVEHDPAELAELVLAYARDEVPDHQMAAWCMAVYFRGLSAAETQSLTDAMIRSGETLDLSALLGRKVSIVSTMASQPPMISDDLRRQADHFIDLASLKAEIGRDPSERPARRPEPADAHQDDL